MRYNLSGLSKEDQALVRKAVRVWNQVAGNRRIYKQKMVADGWSFDADGSFKMALIKGRVVVKCSARSHDPGALLEVDGEWEQWKHASPSLRRHLTRCFLYTKGLLVQERVHRPCSKSYSCAECEKVAEKLNLQDWGQNHGHSKRGVVKFFDWVYQREGWYDYTPDNHPTLE